MKTKLYFAYSYTKRHEREQIYTKLKALLEQNEFSVYSFVFDFTDVTVSDQELMKQALNKIDEADMLIADPHIGSFGIGLEAGYAKAKNKKIVYLCAPTTNKEQTLLGIADYIFDYSNDQDIYDWFSKNLSLLRSTL